MSDGQMSGTYEENSGFHGTKWTEYFGMDEKFPLRAVPLLKVWVFILCWEIQCIRPDPGWPLNKVILCS